MKRTLIWLSVIVGIVLVYGIVDYVQAEIKNKDKKEKLVVLNQLKKDLNKDLKEIKSKEEDLKNIITDAQKVSAELTILENDITLIKKRSQKQKMAESEENNYKKKIKKRDHLQIKIAEKGMLYSDELTKYKNMMGKYNAKLKKASEFAKEIGEKWDLQPVFSIY
ncbi:hypothetical protein ACQKCU_19300 [Heyndrickxia sporothermodurans]